MPFGLKNAPTIFSRVVVVVFKEYIHKFLEVYFEEWTVFGLLKKHVANGGVAQLAKLNGEVMLTLVNGSRLNLYRDNPPSYLA